MQPGGSSHPSGRYGNGNGGFRDGRAAQQPSRPPPAPPQQQLTPQEKEATLLAAGRLAAEYLVARGDLAPHVLENRPPAPIPSRQQHHRPAPHRTIHFQRRPPAPQQHGHFQWELRPYEPQRRQPWPRPFQGGPGPFPKRTRQQRPFPYAARGPSAPLKPGYAGQGAAASVPTSKVEEDDGRSAPAGDTMPTAQPSGATPGPQQTKQPSSSSVGANDNR